MNHSGPKTRLSNFGLKKTSVEKGKTSAFRLGIRRLIRHHVNRFCFQAKNNADEKGKPKSWNLLSSSSEKVWHAKSRKCHESPQSSYRQKMGYATDGEFEGIFCLRDSRSTNKSRARPISRNMLLMIKRCFFFKEWVMSRPKCLKPSFHVQINARELFFATTIGSNGNPI